MRGSKSPEIVDNVFEEEHPTRPVPKLKTSTSRWRAVASAALQRGFGRMSEGDFHLGNAPAPTPAEPSTAEAGDASQPESDAHLVAQSGTEPIADAVSPEDGVEMGIDIPVEYFDPKVFSAPRPSRDFGPFGTVRIVARRDLGPTGTVLVRRRSQPDLGVLSRVTPRHRFWIKVGTAAAAGLVVVALVATRSDPPHPEPAVAAPTPVIVAPPAIDPSPAMVPESTTPAPALDPTAAPLAAPTVAAPSPRTATPAKAGNKAPRPKSAVF